MTEAKILTLDEVAKHNRRGDVWMVIGNKVIDVSRFLDEHPGGEEVLMEQAGMDATEPFEEIGHSDDARALLDTLIVGQLDPAQIQEKKPAPKPSAPAKKPQGTLPTVLYLAIPIAVAVAVALLISPSKV